MELQEISQIFTLVPELYDEVVQKSGDAHLNLERLIHFCIPRYPWIRCVVSQAHIEMRNFQRLW